MEPDPKVDMSPEKRLVMAIFNRAARDILCPENCTQKKHIRSAKAYFENLNPNEFGTLGHFCLVFNLDHKEVKRVALSDYMRDYLIAVSRRGKNISYPKNP